jgi:hypothetical protein
MRLRAVLTIALTCVTVVSVARAADCKSRVDGDLRIHSVTSKIFNNTRSIRVLLPPGYDAAANRSERYPVLYMLDGQNQRNTALGGFRYVYEQGGKHSETDWARRAEISGRQLDAATRGCRCQQPVMS